jgi:hypothetical protein
LIELRIAVVLEPDDDGPDERGVDLSVAAAVQPVSGTLTSEYVDQPSDSSAVVLRGERKRFAR